MLASGLRSALSELPSVTVHDLGGTGMQDRAGVEVESRCGLVTFSVLREVLVVSPVLLFVLLHSFC